MKIEPSSKKFLQQSHRLASHLKQPVGPVSDRILKGLDGANSSFKLALRLYARQVAPSGKISTAFSSLQITSL